MIDRAILGWRPYALLLLLCLGLYVPGLASLPVTDRDEARFAQASRQMIETHDLVAIRFQDEARNKKPGGIYWLQAASVSLLSDARSTAVWPYRLPSLLGALTAALVTFVLGAGIVGRKAAFLGAALLATSLGVAAEAHLAKTDAVLLAFVTIAQLALGRIYVGARGAKAPWHFAILFWAALACGILVKGPVAPLVAALTIASLAIFDRDRSWLRGLRVWQGLALLAIIVLPWLIAISTATQGAFLQDSLGKDFLGKLIGAQESHGAPPLYYLALLPITFWPGALFLGAGAAWAWQQRRSPAEKFLICWAVPFWLLLELVPTKLPNYLLPIYPALGLLIGRALVAAIAGELIARRWLDRLALVAWVIATLGLAGALIFLPLRYGSTALIPGIVAAVIAIIIGCRLAIASWRQSAPRPGETVIAGLLVLVIAFTFVAPQLERLWLSRAAAELVRQYGPPPDVPVASTGYAEPSLVFMLGTKTMFVTADRAAEHLTTARGALALVEARSDRDFKDGLAARGWEARPVGEVSGLDYSNGRMMVLTLYAGVPR
jgi:4-amino-4-deoxy-L-arabinose transferase-like glycosyltransferase